MVNKFLKLAILSVNCAFCVFDAYTTGNIKRQLCSRADNFLRNVVSKDGLLVSVDKIEPPFPKIELPFSGHAVVQYLLCIPRNMVVVERGPFATGATKQVNFESNSQAKIIEGYVFIGGEDLKSVCFPSSINVIGVCAFASCWNLGSITFEKDSNLLEIYEAAFRDSAITSITIPDYVQTIGAKVFVKCEKLVSVHFSNSREKNLWIEILGLGLFLGCNNLKEISILRPVKELADGVFYGVNATIHLSSHSIPATCNLIDSEYFRQVRLWLNKLFQFPNTITQPRFVQTLIGKFSKNTGRDLVVYFHDDDDYIIEEWKLYDSVAKSWEVSRWEDGELVESAFVE